MLTRLANSLAYRVFAMLRNAMYATVARGGTRRKAMAHVLYNTFWKADVPDSWTPYPTRAGRIKWPGPPALGVVLHNGHVVCGDGKKAMLGGRRQQTRGAVAYNTSDVCGYPDDISDAARDGACPLHQ